MDRAPVEVRRRIAICLDDAGLHRGVNAAAAELARQGRISAVSCMVGGPHWKEAASALRQHDPAGLDVGLHLDLTEFPLLAGVRRPLTSWLLRSHLGLAGRARMRQEIDAQLDAFEQAMGRPPAYVDGHQHVHQLPGVREPLLEALQAGGRVPRPWLRSTRRPARRGSAKGWLIEALGGQSLFRLAAERGFLQNGHLLGVYDFEGDAARYLALLRDWIDAAVDGDVMMCHAASHAPAEDAIGAARRIEYEVLSGANFGRLLAAAGVHIAPLSRILAA